MLIRILHLFLNRNISNIMDGYNNIILWLSSYMLYSFYKCCFLDKRFSLLLFYYEVDFILLLLRFRCSILINYFITSFISSYHCNILEVTLLYLLTEI